MHTRGKLFLFLLQGVESTELSNVVCGDRELVNVKILAFLSYRILRHQNHARSFHDECVSLQGGSKSGVTDSRPQLFCQIWPYLKKITGRFLGKFLGKWTLNTPSHLAYVATLPCEAVMSANKPLTINYNSTQLNRELWTQVSGPLSLHRNYILS